MSAISTYNGPRPAIERANVRWGLMEDPDDLKRHERLIAATRRIDPKPDAAYEQAAIEARVRSHHWRRRQHQHQNDLRRDGCEMCLGTGEMLVYIDEPAEPCARCQRSYLGDFDPNEPAF